MKTPESTSNDPQTTPTPSSKGRPSRHSIIKEYLELRHLALVPLAAGGSGQEIDRIRSRLDELDQIKQIMTGVEGDRTEFRKGLLEAFAKRDNSLQRKMIATRLEYERLCLEAAIEELGVAKVAILHRLRL